MKTVFFFMGIFLLLFSNCFGSDILNLLKIENTKESIDFITNKKQFQLQDLITEQRHPKTWDLSNKIRQNTLDGIECLLSVDEDISDKILSLAENPQKLQQATNSIKKAILENRKIYVYGCGATGRLAKQMESSFWRPFWKNIKQFPFWDRIKNDFPDIENRLIGEITGGDRALISSLEGFEDLQLIGKLQLKQHNIQPKDVVFAVTEGGETSSVIGTVLAAKDLYNPLDSEKQNHLYFIYNNPDSVLYPFERSRTVLENKDITKICLATGNQALAGSTRMQATTIETFVLATILEQAIYETLTQYLSENELKYLNFYTASLKERLLDFLPLQKAVYNTRNSIALLTDMEANTYKNKGRSTYFAKDALITVFIDSTERSPTFRLSPLDTCNDFSRKSWIQVWTPALNQELTWINFLGRPFNGLNENFYKKPFEENIKDTFLRNSALKSLKKAGNDQQFLYDFSFSQENILNKGPEKNDLGIMVFFEDEIETSFEDIQNWLKIFQDKNAKTAFISLHTPKDFLNKKNYPDTFILQIPIDKKNDPLKIKRHIALKMLLNAHSTGVMAKLGKVTGNTMTNVNPGNLKLIGRATFLIASHVNDHLPENEKISYADANAVLFDAINYKKRSNQTPEVTLSIIRILEALKHKSFVSWKDVEVIQNKNSLENYLNNITH